MKVCLIAVCHGSYKESLIFLDSIDESLIGTNIRLDIFFVENSSQFDEEMISRIRGRGLNYSIQYVESENLGYFPSAIAAIKRNEIVTTDYEYLIISNVDLIISKSFFTSLQNIPFSKNVGVYAPAILSNRVNVDRNPKIRERPSANKLRLNLLLFSSAPSYAFLVLTNYIRLKLRKFLKFGTRKAVSSRQINNTKIYAPHGSFILMTNKFSQSNLILDYPVFLFGEEIYIAETARASNLDIKYAPNLVINDTEHASTSLLNNKNYRSFNAIALAYLLKTFRW